VILGRFSPRTFLTMPGSVSALGSGLTQFWRPASVYRMLGEPRWALLAVAAAAAVIACSGFLPAAFTDWEELRDRMALEAAPDLAAEGYTPAQADSLIAVELQGMQEFARGFPMAMLLERSVIALVAALAAFGIAFAVEGRKVGKITDYVTSSMLSQAAYSITASVVFLAAMAVRLPGSVSLSLGAFVPVGVQDPGRLHVFLYRFLSSFDLPSLAALFLWGTGLAVLNGRDRGWGLRLCLSVFLLGVLLVSLPVMFAPSVTAQ
jgi:hypothetical protein